MFFFIVSSVVVSMLRSPKRKHGVPSTCTSLDTPPPMRASASRCASSRALRQGRCVGTKCAGIQPLHLSSSWMNERSTTTASASMLLSSR